MGKIMLIFRWYPHYDQDNKLDSRWSILDLYTNSNEYIPKASQNSEIFKLNSPYLNLN